MSETINSKIIVDPTRYFEVNGEKCKLLCAPLVLSVANDQQLIAAVTGKIIRVMGMILQCSSATVGNITFENGSGGSDLFGPLNIPPSTAGDTFQLPIFESGYFETSSGTGLYGDVVTGGILASLFYITYTP